MLAISSSLVNRNPSLLKLISLHPLLSWTSLESMVKTKVFRLLHSVSVMIRLRHWLVKLTVAQWKFPKMDLLTVIPATTSVHAVTVLKCAKLLLSMPILRSLTDSVSKLLAGLTSHLSHSRLPSNCFPTTPAAESHPPQSAETSSTQMLLETNQPTPTPAEETT